MSFQLLELTGDAWVSAPDSAGLSIQDDLDLRIRCALDDWTPGSAIQTLISKRTGGSEWQFRIGANALELVIWISSSDFAVAADAQLPFTDGQMGWVRCDRSGTSLDFYYSTDDTDDHTAVTWTQLGTTRTIQAGSIDTGAATAVTIGANATNGDEPLFGYVRAVAIVEDATTRADPVFADSAEWTVGDDAGDTASDGTNTWTLGDQAEIVGDNIQGAYVTVQAAFGYDPFFEQPIWTSLRSDLRGVEFERGRQYELDRIEAGTMTVTLGNNHGNYNAHNTQGAYFPNIKPTVPIRLRAVYDNVVYPLWSGFVERWPVSFPGKTDSVVEVQCVDLFKLLSLAQAAAADRESAVDALSPIAHWRFGDTSDRTGNGHTLTFSGSPTAGDADGAWQEDEATTFDGTDDAATVADEGDVEREGLDRTWEAWVYPSSGGSGLDPVVAVEDGSGDFLVRLFYNHTSGIFGTGPSAGLIFTEAAAADTWHHLVISDEASGSDTIRNFYLNGVLAGTRTYTEPSNTWTVNIGKNVGSVFWQGRISEIAVYPTALTQTQVQSLFDAKTEAYIDQLTSERVAYFLDNFTFPSTPPQNLEAGQTTIDGPNSPTDGSVLAGIQVAAETENGVFFIAANGDATFHDRDYRSTDQASSTATFGPGDLGIWNIDLAFDDERIYNEIKIAPDDNTDPFISRDQDSIDAHGRRTFERTIYPADANEALDAANWLRAVYAEAATRIGTMSLRPGTDAALWPVVLAAEIGNRYTINKTATGDDYSDDHYLESISMKITREKTWEVDWQLSPANDFTVWILGDDNLSILGDTTVLGY